MSTFDYQFTLSDWREIIQEHFHWQILVDRQYMAPLNRLVIFPASRVDRVVAKLGGRILHHAVRRFIHPNAFGYPKGQGMHQSLKAIRDWRRDGYSIYRADFRKAFNSVDIHRLFKLMKDCGIDPTLFFMPLIYGGKPLSYSGLAQGLPWSPILFSLYTTSFLKRLNKRFLGLLYCDDLYVRLDHPGQLGDLEAYLDFCIAKHSHSKYQLKFNRTERKRPRPFSPDEALPIFGILLQGSEVHPQPSRLAVSETDLRKYMHYLYVTQCIQAKMDLTQEPNL